ncbi:DUF4124 domain-containing protein [Candidatus Thiothrix anitrata]|uniref:DUF4124 domain-containing protein n=1 Tax=Candidatus Thiothrix anitrata TaxID=2823902 RepID=A0ABX7WZH3_9GAMM|nr:DUF4124 domain-containing protein [Candidatus Thiothrix anitrata]QTR49027.1 DUF4124 domain-containing protein [Candidatus Thiothrix anitrata]
MIKIRIMVGNLNLLKLLLAAVLLCLATVLNAGVYRWIDSDGTVHYADVVPPAVASQGHSELNQQGMTRKTVAAAPSPEVIAAQQRSETLAKLRAQKENEQQQRDKYLLANYANVAELEAVFKSKLELLEKNTQSMQERRDSLKKRLETVKKQLEDIKDASQRKTLEGYVSEAETTLGHYIHALQENQTEQDNLRQHYDKDKARLSELLKKSPSSPHPDQSKAPATPRAEPARQ